MGKGIPAALLDAATKSHFIEALGHLMALSKNGKLPEPKEIVTLAHAEVARHLITLENFVTLCYARLDLNRLRFTDSSGLGAFTSCLRELNTKGGDVKPCGMSKQIRAVFELVRMHRIFDI
jgi:anti-anti-sigma factor